MRHGWISVNTARSNRARISGVTTLANARISGSTVTLSEPRTSGMLSGSSARLNAAIAAPLAFSTDISSRGSVPLSVIREPRLISAPAKSVGPTGPDAVPADPRAKNSKRGLQLSLQLVAEILEQSNAVQPREDVLRRP